MNQVLAVRLCGDFSRSWRPVSLAQPGHLWRYCGSPVGVEQSLERCVAFSRENATWRARQHSTGIGESPYTDGLPLLADVDLFLRDFEAA